MPLVHTLVLCLGKVDGGRRVRISWGLGERPVEISDVLTRAEPNVATICFVTTDPPFQLFSVGQLGH